MHVIVHVPPLPIQCPCSIPGSGCGFFQPRAGEAAVCRGGGGGGDGGGGEGDAGQVRPESLFP